MSVNLTIRAGRHPEPMPILLARLVLASSPTWVWVEPTPTKERLKNFPGWWSGSDAQKVAWPAALDEARLFCPGASLTLVTDGAGTRWAWHSVRAECPALLGDGIANPPLEVKPAPSTSVVIRRERDWQRYGLSRPPALPESLRVVEYRRGTQLVCWMLEPSPDPSTTEESPKEC